ncbi:RNA polymerase sigma factor [Nakamurella lactea]|uniref:RNA polymerase sigma factor n=1 Tax=Nakamurella lactea TaxID=459515 RepID=UPI0003FA07EE|nr:sigma-70 family RNA polymerase sigma factor [Nakamurella lactea]
MTPDPPDPTDPPDLPAPLDRVRQVLAAAHRTEWARVLAATVRVTRDLDLAQECCQDAYARALQTWPASGIPASPGGWLTTVARNRAKDVLQRESRFRRVMPQLVVDDPVEDPAADPNGSPAEVPVDDRLALIFICCHPTLSGDAQVALSLRLLCGLSTAEVASAFLVTESTMAARITRAKKKISGARIPFRVPSDRDLPERVAVVLDVLHLVFSTGHTAPIGDQLVRNDLLDNAIGLTRQLRELLPDQPEVAALLALMLLIDARRDSRLTPAGELVLLPDQDRSRWDRGKIDEGARLLAAALAGSSPGTFAVQAAIAAVHAEAACWDDTDWAEIVGLYDLLRARWPSPVVELNRAVAIGMRDGPQAGLDALQPLLDESTIATYSYLSAARADFLRRLHRWTEAADAYQEALALTDNAVERSFLSGRLGQVRAHR